MALLLALTLAFIGCPTDGGGGGGGGGPDEPEPPIEGGGIQWGDDLGMPKPALVGSGITYDDETGIMSITAGSNVGFTWTWAELSTAAGETISQDSGSLFVYYVIDVIKPAAVLSFKNPGNMQTNAPEVTGNPQAGWGTGKGAEYVLGHNTLSNYNKGDAGKIVSGLYDATTGRGWFEINTKVFPSGTTGVGFQHNFWADTNGDGVKIAENSEYKLKIISILPEEPDMSVKVNLAAIPGVTAPIKEETPVTEITATAQYTGAVAWKDADGEALSGNFAPDTVYTATITLTANEGFTFEGVTANFFTVAGATATNPANSGVVTAVFPKTAGADEDNTVNIAAIQGVTAPAGEEVPVTAITATAQYTGTVTWASGDPAVELTGNFAYATVYTATITLVAEEGFTFIGVAEDFFEVAGANATNPADSGTITAVFPATGAAPPQFAIKVNNVDQNAYFFGTGATVTKLADPAKGLDITNTAGYGGAYASFEVDFGAGKTLADYPKLTFKWKGIEGDLSNKNLSVWVSGTPFSGSVVEANRNGVQYFSGANAAEASGQIYLYAPAVTSQKVYIALNIWAATTSGTPAVATNYQVYDIAFDGYTPEAVPEAGKAIGGVAAPMTGVAPATTVTNNAYYAGTIAWADDDGEALTGNFETDTKYTATITLLPKPPYTFTGVAEGFFTVAGADTVTYNAGSNVVTAVFPATVAPLLSFPITYTGGAPTGATTEVLYTAVRTINATVSPEQNGYAATNTEGNRYALPGAFVVDLGDKTLTDFATVTFTFTGVSGDFGYKRLGLFAAAAGEGAGLPTAGGYTIADVLVTKASTGSSGSPPTNTTGGGENLAAQTITLEIDPTLLASNAVWTSNQIEICIWEVQSYIPANVSFKITNITFNP